MHVKFGRSNLFIRPFRTSDTPNVVDLLSGILQEYGFTLDIQSTDMDYADIGQSYSAGEFWVCIDPSDNHAVVGTVAFRPARWNTQSNSNSDESSIPRTSEAELRRLYVAPNHRRTGLGAFLLAAIEHRAFKAGFKEICLESAGVLKEATKLYKQFNYQHTTLPGDTCITKRCDVVMSKKLSLDTFRDFVAVCDTVEPNNQFAIVPQKIAERSGVPFKRV